MKGCHPRRIDAVTKDAKLTSCLAVIMILVADVDG
jgi:hypothetical protein